MKFFSKIVIVPVLLLSLFLTTVYAQLNLKNNLLGIEGAVLENVTERLTIIQDPGNREVTPELLERWYELGPRNIRIAMQPYGYFNPIISSSINRDVLPWVANYVIDPGPSTVITNVDLRISGPGSDMPQFERLRKNFNLKVGDVLLNEEYVRAKGILFEVANNLGYLNAYLTRSEIEVDIDKNTASVFLHFDTGPRYYFGEIAYQQEAFQERFLQRFVDIQPGQPFSPRKLLNSQSNLVDSNYFSYVSFNPDFNAAEDNHIPINIELDPYKPRQYLIGAGFGTDTGVRGTLGVNHRRVTRTGHQFNAYTQIGQRIQNAIASYIIPGPNPLRQQFALSGGLERRSFKLEDNKNLTNTYGILTGSYIYTRDRWQNTLSMNYQRDINTGDSVNAHTTLVYPSLGLSYLSVSDPIVVDNGMRFNLTFLGGHEKFFSDASFFQTRADTKYIKSIIPEFTRLVLRGAFGYTTVDDQFRLPLSLRFFAGGSESVRGYQFEELAGVGEDGKLLEGGNALLTGSAELQQRIFGNLYAGVFYDVGNAFSRYPDPQELKHSAGLAAIYMTPIGPFELSFARRLNKGEEKRIFIHFSMGPDL